VSLLPSSCRQIANGALVLVELDVSRSAAVAVGGCSGFEAVPVLENLIGLEFELIPEAGLDVVLGPFGIHAFPLRDAKDTASLYLVNNCRYGPQSDTTIRNEGDTVIEPTVPVLATIPLGVTVARLRQGSQLAFHGACHESPRSLA
jgi:hypothetical protein